MWVERLISATSWDPLNLNLLWNDIEEELGTSLPEDYKKLAESFGTGEFSDFMQVLSVDSTGQFDLAHIWKKNLDSSPQDGRHPAYEPYQIYRPGRRGIIRWGFGEMDCNYFWLASADDDPATWPIVTQGDAYPWHQVSMSTTEFVYRVLADPEFKPFSIAHLIPQPSFYSIDNLDLS